MRSPSTSPLSPSTKPSFLNRKLVLLFALILTLGLLNDVQDDVDEISETHSDGDNITERQHLALLTALSRHPPSLRVFRLIFTSCFIMYCSALALWVWEKREVDEVGMLLFARLEEDHPDSECDQNVEKVGEAVDEEFRSDGAVMRRPRESPQPPSSTSVLGAALDISILSCACLICFTVASAEGGRYINAQILGNTISNGSNSNKIEESYLKVFCEATAPLFPLGLFCFAVYKALFPWKERGEIWITLVGMTVGAPFCEVTFRDGFIGDAITSAVRPLQDLLFTLFFLPLGLRAYWSSYTVDAAAIPIERNWIVHTLLLPACTLSPQWWRFCQNLRQSYDTKKRWPYLGNAFKYMFAAEVATFGMFDPSIKKNPVWICCFAMATLYQVWWDVFMDWNLFEWDYVGRRLALREERLYKRTWVYYLIFVINFLLRFVGMITLIPPVHLSRTTGLIVKTFPDYWMFLGPLAAGVEIFRRTVWALLRLEWEVIKTRKEAIDRQACITRNNHGETNEIELSGLEQESDMTPMTVGSSFKSLEIRHTLKSIRLSSMSDMNDVQILTELGVWATVFSGIAIIAAAHREVL